METIFGLATPLGKSGVAVLRISGSRATDVFGAFGLATPQPRLAALKKLRHMGQVVDEALVLYFENPNSFTGEDVVELHTHGSRAVIKHILEILTNIPGYRMAKPGEFSRRAFLNNKMDLLEAEGLADLIDSETSAQSKQAMRQMQGELGMVYEAWRTQLIENLANIEAYIDFPDENLPPELERRVYTGIQKMKQDIATSMQDNRRGEKIREGINVVILGAPNVGKSSLLNFLARRDVAIVSDIAGTTRDAIEVHLELAGYAVTIIDTAGLRETTDSIESEGIKRALSKAKNADIKILLLDSANSNPDLSMADADTIITFNKTDVIPAQAGILKAKIPACAGMTEISVATGLGMDEFLHILTKKITSKFETTENPIITRQRHREALTKALAALQDFSFEKPIELVAEDLRHSAFHIGSITGKIDVEDILDKIFSSFCIGK